MSRNPLAKITKTGLRGREIVFVSEYVKDANGARAAREAGYAEVSAKEQAHYLLQKERVKNAIKQALAELTKKRRNVSWILSRLEHMSALCSDCNSEFYNPNAANKSFELLGKYHKMYTEKLEITGREDLAARIKEGRRRASVTMKETIVEDDRTIIREFTITEDE